MKKVYVLAVITALLTACSNNDNKQGNSADNNDTLALIDNYLSKLSAEKNFSGGLLIIRGDKKILCKGYGWADKEKKTAFTENTLASMGSITKAFTATAIMKLVEQDKMSVDDTLKKFFPAVPADKANITIHQLLTHSSGFHEFLQNDGGDYAKTGTEEFLKKAFAEPLAFVPGQKAVYTNVGMSILAIILEKVSGLDYEQFLRKELLEPAGIKDIGYHYPSLQNDRIARGYQNGKPWGTIPQRFVEAGGGPFWNLKGNGGLEASLNDMFLWANSFTNHTILKESTIQKMFTQHIAEDGYDGKSFFGYGCNISKSRRNTKMIDNGGSNGIYFARLIRLPEEGLVFYMVTNESSLNTNMVLPNVTQLYFQGKISQDVISMQPGFRDQLSQKVYDLLDKNTVTELGAELDKQGLKIEDDMILLEAGQRLIAESKNEKALVLYKYYTKSFPNIIVAWNDMGEVYQSLNNKEEAIKCHSQALKLRPGNPRAKENLEKLLKKKL